MKRLSPRARHWMIGIVNLVAVLVIYFAVPIRATASVPRLVIDLAVSIAAIAVAGRVLFHETIRLNTEGTGRLNGVRLVLLLEIVMLVFALTYYILAVDGHEQMAGIHTRLDALYFTVVTMTTVGYGDIHPIGQAARAVATAHLLFDLVFIAAFAGLIRGTVANRTQQRASGQGAQKEPEEGTPPPVP